jgi:hypothetical protein
MIIRDLFRTPGRFLRSAHLERDFEDSAALRDYIVTPPIADALRLVIEGLRTGSKRRAWRVTGDYGSGKSSFALALAHLLREPRASALAHVRSAVDLGGLGRSPRMLPILVTGSREGIVPAVARGVESAVSRLGATGAAEFAAEAPEVAARGDGAALVSLLERLTFFAVGVGYTGAVLIIDEMGKLLEHAALHPDREDVFVLQRLAEAADRSARAPLVVLGLLHHGFHAYAERLPAAARHEWEKVAERFQEIVFDQPLAHVAALVAGALTVRVDALPDGFVAAAERVRREALEAGWLGPAHAAGSLPDPLSHYPLHPMVLPVMARFFGRFGQHERSLFSFILSSEPFGLQTFADRRVDPAEWFRISDLYDYVRAVFGYRLSGSRPRGQWARLIETMDALSDVSDMELRILKSVALLNLLDAEDLLPTDRALAAALGKADLGAEFGRLTDRRMLYRRGPVGGYCLWPTSSVNLDAAFQAAEQALGPLGPVSQYLAAHLEPERLLARRHYIEHGTLRHFEVRYAPVAKLRSELTRDTPADGIVLVALCDDLREHAEARGFAESAEASSRPDVIVAVPRPLGGLAADVQEVRALQWVLHHTPELAHDSYGAAEARRQLAGARLRLRDRLAAFISFGGGPAVRDTEWSRAGERLEVPEGRGLLAALSPICNDLYGQAPRIYNELLNRRQLSSAATSARTRLVERMLAAPEKPSLGMDTSKAPPERSMYLSVLAAGGVHREKAGRWLLGTPEEAADELRLRPALGALMRCLEAGGDQRVPVPLLVDAVRVRPFGVRDGVIPLLLAILLAGHGHEIAVYENGTFVQRFGASEFLRMTKIPTAFEFQLCKIAGIRTGVFARLVDVVAARPEGRTADVLDVVIKLCRFAAELPEYTRRSNDLTPVAMAVRNALLYAREPTGLLFRDLPLACGFDPFTPDLEPDEESARAFADRLREAMDELRAAYPALLARIRARLVQALDLDPAEGRAALATAAQVALAVREPRLRVFARRLADGGLGEEAWIEAVASVVLAKPPARWVPGDEARCGDELDVLGATFRRVRAIHFEAEAPLAAVRVSLTHGDGVESARVVQLGPELTEDDEQLLGQIRALLPEGERRRLMVIAQLLQDALAQEEERVQATAAVG